MKKDGSRKRTYKFKQSGSDAVVINVEAVSTSVADFTITKLKPKLYKRDGHYYIFAPAGADTPGGSG